MAESDLSAGFDAAAFRSRIRATMQMGMPPDLADQLTWHWKTSRTYNPEDRAHNPYDWGQTATTDAPGNPDEPSGSLIVDYAVEFSARPAASTQVAMGEFDATRAVVTLLDEDFEQIKTADFATMGDTAYIIDFTGPPIGMFSVGVHTVYLTARDQA